MNNSYYCEKLEKTLHFMPDGVKFCCSCAEGAGIKIEDFSKFNKEDIINAKNKYIQMLKKEIFLKNAQDALNISKKL